MYVCYVYFNKDQLTYHARHLNLPYVAYSIAYSAYIECNQIGDAIDIGEKPVCPEVSFFVFFSLLHFAHRLHAQLDVSRPSPKLCLLG